MALISGVNIPDNKRINISLKLELDYLHELMVLASIGIIADKVPIINENRYISY